MKCKLTRALDKDQLLDAFRVPEDHTLLLGVFHVLKAHEEEMLQNIREGQSDMVRREITTIVMTCRDVAKEIDDLVDKANETVKDKRNE